jgi:cytoskeletal protein CcmA (bactofilin family)
MASSYPSSADRPLESTNGQASAFLGRGTRVSGKITFEGPARIEGQVEGEVVASDSLLVGETAVLNAQLSGSTVVIHGKVTGDINATKRLEIRAPGRVYGNVTTPSLIIEEGVVFEGHCSMGAAENRGSKVTLLAKDDKPPIAAAPPQSPQAALKVQGDVK